MLAKQLLFSYFLLIFVFLLRLCDISKFLLTNKRSYFSFSLLTSHKSLTCDAHNALVLPKLVFLQQNKK